MPLWQYSAGFWRTVQPCWMSGVTFPIFEIPWPVLPSPPESGPKLNLHVRKALISKILGRRGEMLKWPPRRDVSLASSFTRCRTRNNPNKNKFRALCGLFSQHVGVLGVGGRKKGERSALCSVKCIEIISECLLRRYEGGVAHVSCDVRKSVDERQTFKLCGIP